MSLQQNDLKKFRRILYTVNRVKMSELVLRLINGISSDHEGVTLQQLNTYLISPHVDGQTLDPDDQFDITTTGKL